MKADQRRLEEAVPDLIPQNGSQPFNSHADCCEEQHREEQVFLISDGALRHAPRAVSLLFAHRQEKHGQIRIQIDMVGVLMMSIMLVDPPPIAYTKQQIA